MAQSYSVQAVLSAVDIGFTSTFNAATYTAMSMGEKVSSNLKTIGNVTSAVGLSPYGLYENCFFVKLSLQSASFA